MATPLTGEKVEIFQEDVDFNSPNSEAVQTKIAKAALFAQDVTEYPVSFKYGGYFRGNTVVNESERFVITKRSTIARYIMSISESGSSVANELNVKIYDDAGAFVNDLFGVEPSILSPSNRSNSFIGRDVAATTTLSGNLIGATTNFGTLNVTILEEGWQLVGEVISNAEAAKGAELTLTLQRLE